MDIKKFIFDILRLLLPSSWNRTGSALAIISASALTGWVDQLGVHLVGFKLEQTTPWIGFTVMLGRVLIKDSKIIGNLIQTL